MQERICLVGRATAKSQSAGVGAKFNLRFRKRRKLFSVFYTGIHEEPLALTGRAHLSSWRTRNLVGRPMALFGSRPLASVRSGFCTFPIESPTSQTGNTQPFGDGRRRRTSSRPAGADIALRAKAPSQDSPYTPATTTPDSTTTLFLPSPSLYGIEEGGLS